MGNLIRVAVVMMALVFGISTMALAADFYIVKETTGKMSIVDTKPADAKSIVKGPFKTKEEADKAMKAMSSTKPALPDQGC
jgi:hypothetical protein